MGFCCVALGACCRVRCEQSDGNDVLVLLALVDELVRKVVILCWLGRPL